MALVIPLLWHLCVIVMDPFPCFRCSLFPDNVVSIAVDYPSYIHSIFLIMGDSYSYLLPRACPHLLLDMRSAVILFSPGLAF